jgi:hypothetical protein
VVAGASGVQYLRGVIRGFVNGGAMNGRGPDDGRGYRVVRLPLEDYRDTTSR